MERVNKCEEKRFYNVKRSYDFNLHKKLLTELYRFLLFIFCSALLSVLIEASISSLRIYLDKTEGKEKCQNFITTAPLNFFLTLST